MCRLGRIVKYSRIMGSTLVLPDDAYRMGTSVLTTCLESKLRLAQQALEKTMLGLPLMHKKTALRITRQAWVEDILLQIKSNWSMAGHVMRMTDNRCTIRSTKWISRDDKSIRGRAETRWREEIRNLGGKQCTVNALWHDTLDISWRDLRLALDVRECSVDDEKEDDHKPHSALSSFQL